MGTGRGFRGELIKAAEEEGSSVMFLRIFVVVRVNAEWSAERKRWE